MSIVILTPEEKLTLLRRDTDEFIEHVRSFDGWTKGLSNRPSNGLLMKYLRMWSERDSRSETLATFRFDSEQAKQLAKSIRTVERAKALLTRWEILGDQWYGGGYASFTSFLSIRPTAAP